MLKLNGFFFKKNVEPLARHFLNGSFLKKNTNAYALNAAENS